MLHMFSRQLPDDTQSNVNDTAHALQIARDFSLDAFILVEPDESDDSTYIMLYFLRDGEYRSSTSGRFHGYGFADILEQFLPTA